MNPSPLHQKISFAVAVASALALALVPGISAQTACLDTAQAMSNACKNEVKDDYWEAVAICFNVTDEEEQDECNADAEEERSEAAGECAEQKKARRDLCDDLDEDAYDPDFDPGDFDSDFTNLTNPNPYYPIAVGNTWTLAGDGEDIFIQVHNKTKNVEGVTCIVVQDTVLIDGVLHEDTLDWYAHGVDGSVHYCGELSRDYELIVGDMPMEPELVEIDGTFKAGRDGSKSGVIMLANPQPEDIYRQEWALGNAEDAAEVLSNTYSYGNDLELDTDVPQVLAGLLCSAANCVVTRDFAPLDPDVEEYKYYAPGIGIFLEVNKEDGEIVQLIDCNFDPVCGTLPTP